MVRVFLAIDLPENLKRDLAQLSKEIPLPRGRFKWVEEENFHITIKFLGSINENQIKRIEKLCQGIAEDFMEFELVIGGLGTFPERGRPRVLWLGFEEGAETLKSLADRVQKILKESKITDVVEDYHPHITLMRIKDIEDDREFRDFFERLTEICKTLKGRKFSVAEIILFKSDLSSKGPRYTPLFRVRLRK